jgi:hypothetical protein
MATRILARRCYQMARQFFVPSFQSALPIRPATTLQPSTPALQHRAPAGLEAAPFRWRLHLGARSGWRLHLAILLGQRGWFDRFPTTIYGVGTSVELPSDLSTSPNPSCRGANSVDRPGGSMGLRVCEHIEPRSLCAHIDQRSLPNRQHRGPQMASGVGAVIQVAGCRSTRRCSRRRPAWMRRSRGGSRRSTCPK